MIGAYLVCVCALTLLVSSFAVEKRWLPDLEWRTKSNWIDERVPEIDSSVVFPLLTRHPVGLPESGDFQLSKIDLTREGSLVLQRNGKVQLSDSRGAIEKISRWAKEGRFLWVDPDNWHSISDAAPHLERLPCNRDNVVLPESNHTMSISLPVSEINVRSIRTRNDREPLSKGEWQELRNKREFAQRGFTVKYSQYSCESCVCKLDAGYVEEVCSVETLRCGFAYCEFPLQVEGHCCLYCGGRISFPKKTPLAFVRTTADDALERYSADVGWYVRRISTGEVEILIKERDVYSGIDTYNAIEALKRAFRGTSVEILKAETAGAPMSGNRLAVALGSFFGAPLVVFVLLLIAFSYFGYTFGQVFSGCAEAWASVRDGIRGEPLKAGKPAGYARFENVPEGNVQISRVPGSIEDKLEVTEDGSDGSPSGGRFENPLYRSKRSTPKGSKEGDILDMNAPLSLATLKHTVETRIELADMAIDE